MTYQGQTNHCCYLLWRLAVIFLVTIGHSHSAMGSELPTLQMRDQNGTPVPHAVVMGGTGSGSTETLAAAVMDQKDKAFVPYVLAVPVNSMVNFPNSDDTRHHVYSFSPAKTFELKLYRTNEAPPVNFDKPGIVSLGCNIHDSMKGYIYVTDQAILGVSDERGLVVLAADQRWPESMELWHPQLTSTLTVKPPAPGRGAWQIDMPFIWEEPQQGKTVSELESRFKKYQRHGR